MMAVFRNSGYLIGVRIIRESYSSGVYLGGSLFSKPPHMNHVPAMNMPSAAFMHLFRVRVYGLGFRVLDMQGLLTAWRFCAQKSKQDCAFQCL